MEGLHTVGLSGVSSDAAQLLLRSQEASCSAATCASVRANHQPLGGLFSPCELCSQPAPTERLVLLHDQFYCNSTAHVYVEAGQRLVSVVPLWTGSRSIAL